MKPQICICCGEPMIEGGNTLSRNPNVCASCSSLEDGMSDGDAGKRLIELESIRPSSEDGDPCQLEPRSTP